MFTSSKSNCKFFSILDNILPIYLFEHILRRGHQCQNLTSICGLKDVLLEVNKDAETRSINKIPPILNKAIINKM